MNLTRQHPDPLADGGAPLALDRQRVIHSAAFRRLEYKTQVFVALEGDHFRTRLTHTLEVATLARDLAAGLDLSAELAEVVSLAHDLGHSPFGHAGERALDECLAGRGGFEHNAHSLRVVEYLEHPYPTFRGLNLTHVVRECLAKHSTQFDKPGFHPLQDGAPPPPEGDVAALADQLAYGMHDLQDGLHSGLIEPGALDLVELWRDAYEGPPPGEGGAWRGHVRPAIDRIRQRLIRDAIEYSRPAANPPPGGRDARHGDDRRLAIALSPAMDAKVRELGAFLLNHLYRNSRLVRMDTKAKRIIHAIYDAYVAEPKLMPGRYARRVADQGVERVAVDYIAGMTDRFCLEEHARLFDPKITP